MTPSARVPTEYIVHRKGSERQLNMEHAIRHSESSNIRGTAGQKYFRSTSDVYQSLGRS